jgi:hypothetical protein
MVLKPALGPRSQCCRTVACVVGCRTSLVVVASCWRESKLKLQTPDVVSFDGQVGLRSSAAAITHATAGHAAAATIVSSSPTHTRLPL